MKNAYLTVIFALVAGGAWASKADTTVIEYHDKGIKKRITIQSDKKNLSFQVPKSLNLNNILKEIGIDSIERDKALILIEKNGKKDTILSLSKDGQNIKIITRDPRTTGQDTLNRKGPRRAYDEHSPEDIKAADEAMEQKLDEEKDDDFDEQDPPKKVNNSPYFKKKDFGLYLGINGWQNTFDDQMPGLETWKSRYVALSWRRNNRIISFNKFAEVALSYGPEIAWYNYSFSNQNRLDVAADKVMLLKETDIKKSKLVVPSVNLPVLLNIGSKKSKFNIALGVFGGINLKNYTRTDYLDDPKNKEKNDFQTEKFRYGTTLEFGRKNGITFFGRLENSNFFNVDQLPPFRNLNAWSVGIRL